VDQTKLGDTHRLAAYKQLRHRTELAAISTTTPQLSQQLQEMSMARGGRSHSTNTSHLKNTTVLPHSTTTLEHHPAKPWIET
jgi:hypothetical protein